MPWSLAWEIATSPLMLVIYVVYGLFCGLVVYTLTNWEDHMSGMTREFGLTPDGGAAERTGGSRLPTEKPTSTILRDLASIRDRVIKEKDAEYTADRWVLWGDVIDAVNALEQNVFAIVRYDDARTKAGA